MLVRRHFAAQDRPESGEGVVHVLVVDGLVQVLDEDVAHPGFSQGWVPLRPHDPNWLPFHDVKIHRVQGSLGCN